MFHKDPCLAILICMEKQAMVADNRKEFAWANRLILDIALFAIVLLGVGNILHALPFKFRMIPMDYAFFSPDLIVLHRVLSAVTGFALIFVTYRLFRRVKTAWVAAIILLSLSAFLHLFHPHGRPFYQVIILLECLVIAVLLWFRRDFSRVPDPITLKWGIMLAFASLALVFLNTIAGLLLLRHFQWTFPEFADGLVDSCKLLFFMDASYIEPRTAAAMAFGRSAVLLNWTSMAAALFFVLKPLVYQPIHDNLSREKARKLLLEYGINPISYLAVEKDKRYFFGSIVEGMIAYTVAGSVAVCAGDPVCRSKDTALLVSEFLQFCRQNHHDICFMQVTPDILPYLYDLGFGSVKYGEEAMINLASYEISGGKGAKLRNAIHHAANLGIRVEEYRPLESRDRGIEEQIQTVSQNWLSFKKSGELAFMLGTVSLDSPMDRRYFLALSPNGQVLGFVVFVPFVGGYMADVTRRKNDAPIGIMESILYEAFQKMKREGVRWVSLGLAPLYNVEGTGTGLKTFVPAVLHYVFENLNNLYGFKTLYHYKKKYAPTLWEPRYLSYYPSLFTPQIAYSIIKAQNPRGAKEYVSMQLKSLFHKQASEQNPQEP